MILGSDAVAGNSFVLFAIHTCTNSMQSIGRCKMKPAPANIYSPEVMRALKSRGGADATCSKDSEICDVSCKGRGQSPHPCDLTTIHCTNALNAIVNIDIINYNNDIWYMIYCIYIYKCIYMIYTYMNIDNYSIYCYELHWITVPVNSELLRIFGSNGYLNNPQHVCTMHCASPLDTGRNWCQDALNWRRQNHPKSMKLLTLTMIWEMKWKLQITFASGKDS